MGMLTGSICGGYQSEKLGRKKSLMLDCIFFTIGMILSAAAPNFNTILVARWLVGHASASTKAVAPLYTSEISQPIIRNQTGSLAMICCGKPKKHIFATDSNSRQIVRKS